MPRNSLFFSVFTLFRREASWLLPAEGDPPGVVRDRLKLLCSLLFQDRRSGQMWEWFTDHARHFTERLVQANLQQAARRHEFSPTQESVKTLARTICSQSDPRAAIDRCLASALADRGRSVSPDKVQRFIEDFAKAAFAGVDLVNQTTNDKTKQTKAMRMLYAEAGLEAPRGTRFPEVLCRPFFLDQQTLDKHNQAKFVHHFCSFYLRDKTEQIEKMYGILQTILSTTDSDS